MTYEPYQVFLSPVPWIRYFPTIGDSCLNDFSLADMAFTSGERTGKDAR